MLEVDGLRAGYGKAEVLHGISFRVPEGGMMALLGRNGMGKTTTLSTLMGINGARAGRITVAGEDVTGAAPTRIARLGVGYVPEGRRIFPNLSARENLLATARPAVGGAQEWTQERVLALFPPLAERLSSMGNLLSGGEQQMLAIGRALMTNPRVLILDEATEGLAPVVRHAIWDALSTLKSAGLTLLVVDKYLDQILPLADTALVLERGTAAWSGTGREAVAARDTIEQLIAVH